MFKRHSAHAHVATTPWGQALLWLVAAPLLVAVTFVFERDRSLGAQTPGPLKGVDIPAALEPGSAGLIEAALAAAIAAPSADANPNTEVETEPAPEAAPASETTPTTNLEQTDPIAAAPAPAQGWPWWPWLLALPVLGGLLWWLLKDRAPAAIEVSAPIAAPVAIPVAAAADRRIVLTTHNCRDAYVSWELPAAEVEALRQQNCFLALKLHDVTNIVDVDQQAPHSTYPFDCDTVAVGNLPLPVAIDNRDYLVELGYVGIDGTWHALVRSAPVRVPACPSTVTQETPGVGAAATAAGLGAAGLSAAALGAAAVLRPAETAASARVVLTPRDCKNAHAYWELPQTVLDDLKTGSCTLKARLYDITELPGNRNGLNSLQEFNARLETPGELHLPIAIDDRDYLVEVGYVDNNYQWQALAKSEPVRVPPCPSAASAAAAATNISVNNSFNAAEQAGTDMAGTHTQATSWTAGEAAAVAGLDVAPQTLENRTPESAPDPGSTLGLLPPRQTLPAWAGAPTWEPRAN
jgi:hypothetical protein